MPSARKASVSVSFNGTDISAIIEKYLLSLSYIDNEEDEADDLQIKLEDRNGIWLIQWLQQFIDDASGSIQETSREARTTTANDPHGGIYKSIKKGSSSYDAAICQVYLIALGYLTGAVRIKADDDVVNAIRAFQTASGLAEKNSCDSMTWARLTETINGQTIPQYDYTCKAGSKTSLRDAPSSNGKKIASIPKGSTCTVSEKVTSGWYRVNYENQTGYAKGGELKLVSVDDGASVTRVMRRLQITAKISREDNDRTITTDCGLFELDSVKASGPPATVMIKGSSLAYSGIRKTKNDKSWESYTLRGIAEEIGNRHGLGVLFDALVDPAYDRIEQVDQTDIALLKKLCQDAGYSLKIADNQIVIYDQAKYEAQQEIAAFAFGDGRYIKWSMSTGDGQTKYDACEVCYTDPATGQAIRGTALSEEYKEKLEEAKGESKGKKTEEHEEGIETLVVTNQRVTSVAEAEMLASKLLRLNNKFERHASLTVPGNPVYCAGMTIRLSSWGYWSGKYLISKVKHDFTPGSGYVTTLTLRKVDEVEAPQAAEAAGAPRTGYNVGDIVYFKGGRQYLSSNHDNSTGGTRRAGPAKITRITDLSRRHPYGLLGGHYCGLDGDCNVHGWVDADSFE